MQLFGKGVSHHSPTNSDKWERQGGKSAVLLPLKWAVALWEVQWEMSVTYCSLSGCSKELSCNVIMSTLTNSVWTLTLGWPSLYYGNWMLRKVSTWEMQTLEHTKGLLSHDIANHSWIQSSLIPRLHMRLGPWPGNKTMRLSVYSTNIPSASASFVTPVPSLVGEGWTFGRSVLR